MTRAIRLPQVRVAQHSLTWGTKLLIILLIASAFSLVYLKDLNRRLFIQYQDLLYSNQQAQVESGRLLLEKSTWSTQANVQKTAVAHLNMVMPAAQDIVVVN